ncbi:hypothetical protein Vadar_029253 [Vaccinium darrowii]|uniref:Uncharacterized protein n=1 Tax=Vaccinium darrowii TaxID=229202 RepID=A0ACB7ZF83_9ERIC|nr:hypothetical protein Vadar_029253 [Vaccinium darrowii]
MHNKTDLEAKYGCATIDGFKQKMRKVKNRIWTGDATLNIGRDAPLPIPNSPLANESSWTVKHDRTVIWLARWKDQISNKNKYVTLGAGTKLKGESDKCKYNKAMELKV